MSDDASDETLQRLICAGRVPVTEAILSSPAPASACRPWDRVRGMLLGLAIGDALGNTSEGLLPSQRRERHGEIRDYLPNHHAGGRLVGLPSDDTQLAFWTLEQLIEDGELVPGNLARRFCSGHVPSSGGNCLASVPEFVSHRPAWTLTSRRTRSASSAGSWKTRGRVSHSAHSRSSSSYVRAINSSCSLAAAVGVSSRVIDSALK